MRLLELARSWRARLLKTPISVVPRLLAVRKNRGSAAWRSPPSEIQVLGQTEGGGQRLLWPLCPSRGETPRSAPILPFHQGTALNPSRPARFGGQSVPPAHAGARTVLPESESDVCVLLSG